MCRVLTSLLALPALACRGGADLPPDTVMADAESRPSQDAEVTPDAVASFVPGDAVLISEGSLVLDEDVVLLRGSDGLVYLLWFSEKTGDGDIYLRRTSDGVTWSESIPVTTGSDVDLYPGVTQDSVGRFHAVWFRRVAGGAARIVTNQTDDPLLWDTAGEVEITTPSGGVGDWTPSSRRPRAASCSSFSSATLAIRSRFHASRSISHARSMAVRTGVSQRRSSAWQARKITSRFFSARERSSLSCGTDTKAPARSLGTACSRTWRFRRRPMAWRGPRRLNLRPTMPWGSAMFFRCCTRIMRRSGTPLDRPCRAYPGHRGQLYPE